MFQRLVQNVASMKKQSAAAVGEVLAQAVTTVCLDGSSCLLWAVKFGVSLEHGNTIPWCGLVCSFVGKSGIW